MTYLFRLFLIVVPILLLLLYMMWMPGRSFSHRRDEEPSPKKNAEKNAEENAEEEEIAAELQRHVRTLSEEIGPRSTHRAQGLIDAAAYIRKEFESSGFTVSLQLVTDNPNTFNLIIEKKGAEHPEKILVVGAHYDTVPPSCPGANDNGSGVAALLALTARMKDFTPPITLRFVAFTNEEPPHFMTSTMGSWVYAEAAKTKSEQIIGMISLETIGYYTSDAESQIYPFPLSLFYPDRGDFLGFVGNLRSAALVRKAIGRFRAHGRLPSQGIAAPSWIPGVAWSDQWSFWSHGYPAIMVTDTAPFRYPHYHRVSDTWEKLNYPGFAKAVIGIEAMIRDLCADLR